MRPILGPLMVVAALAAAVVSGVPPGAVDAAPIVLGHRAPPPSDRPDDRTTGPEVSGLDEDDLPRCPGGTGVWTIDTTRTVRGCRFTGASIVVTAPNVRLEDMVILGNSSFIVKSAAPGLVIENSVIGPRPGARAVAPQGQPCSASVGFTGYTLRRVEVYGCADGLKVRGTVAVWSSWFHDLYKGCGGGDCTHNDIVQFQERSTLRSLTFRNNAAYGFACTSNRHFQLKNARNATFDIRDNFFYGMHGILNLDGTAGGNRGIVSGNVYAGRHDEGPFSAKADGSRMAPGLYTGAGLAGITITSNRFEDGAPVPASGRAAPYTCVREPR